MSFGCEGIFLARERRDNKDSSPRCTHEGFCACTNEARLFRFSPSTKYRDRGAGGATWCDR